MMMIHTPELYSLFLQHPTVTTDSRNCPEGSLFFALKGDRFDGNKFAQKALDAGCSYAVIDNPDFACGERTLLVDDVLKSLQQLARLHREKLGLPVIGITGTNGKTTTKELIAAVLSSAYPIEYTRGNLNNSIGVPLSVLKLNRSHQMAVIEMGASHPGDIKELVEIARPNYGVITNIGRAHLEGFGSYENIIRTKGELYDFLKENGGEIFIHREDDVLQKIAGHLPQISYGESDDDFVCGQVVSCDPFLSLEWKEKGKSTAIHTHLIGAYNLMNVLAAIAVGRTFHVPDEKIIAAIQSYAPSNNRSQMTDTAHNSLIIDAYNANPSSMKVALDSFASMKTGPKAVILGDMKELGPTSDALHAEVLHEAEAGGFDRLIFCGENFVRVVNGKYPAFPDTAALQIYLKENPLEGYHILLKASHSMGFEGLKEWL